MKAELELPHKCEVPRKAEMNNEKLFAKCIFSRNFLKIDKIKSMRTGDFMAQIH